MSIVFFYIEFKHAIHFSTIYNFYEINPINRLINIEYQDLENLEDDQDIYIYHKIMLLSNLI